MAPRAFEIAVPKADVDSLYQRLHGMRWPTDVDNADWRYGVERDRLRTMVDYWRNDYDWRARERLMNRYDQYLVEIEGVTIHFLHVRGKGARRRPLLLSHGWPWTFWDFRELIGPLTDPVGHGIADTESFDVVIPSLPGFGFSAPLDRSGVSPPVIAHLFDRLMVDVLSYHRYAAAGGDWGAAITALLGHAHEKHLAGVLLTLALVPGVDLSTLTDADFAADEKWMMARNAEALPLITSHVTVQTQDPQTLAYALADSPVGTAAWLWERRRAWSDCGGDLLSIHDRDTLCDLASIYWLSGSIASSLRIYADTFRHGSAVPLVHGRKPSIAVPTGYLLFPKDLVLAPRSIAAANVALRGWTVMSGGGHFGPAEKPAETAHEIHRFFRTLI